MTNHITYFEEKKKKTSQPTRGITKQRIQIQIAKLASKAVSLQPATKACWKLGDKQ